MFHVTRSGYGVEHEVKLTLADFKADVHKRLYLDGPTKHETLLCKGEGCPRQFFYLVPEGLITLKDLPPWAGLKTIGTYRNGRLKFTLIREAPVLSKSKVTEKVKSRIIEAYQPRYWRMRMKVGQE